ncbi:MAG: hypothetical protein ACRD0P_21525 [Stackebrandtia sp.]
MNVPVRTRWRRWPLWVPWAVVIWGVTYAGFGLVSASNRIALLNFGGSAASGLGWVVAAVGAGSAIAAGAVALHGPTPVLRAFLWVLCAVAGFAAFGLLMDVVTLVFGQGVDAWGAAVNHALAAIGAVLLAAIARSGHSVPMRSGPAASGAVQFVAGAGTLAFAPYVVMKLVWANGGTFAGVTGEQISVISKRNGASDLWLALGKWGLDGTVLLAGLGVFLLWGLVRPWGQVFPRWTLALRGRRVPRWLPLTPALIGAASLAPYGIVGLGYVALASIGVVRMRRGDFSTSEDALLVGWIGLVAFAGYGICLTVAAYSYWRRTRSAG